MVNVIQRIDNLNWIYFLQWFSKTLFLHGYRTYSFNLPKRFKSHYTIDLCFGTRFFTLRLSTCFVRRFLLQISPSTCIISGISGEIHDNFLSERINLRSTDKSIADKLIVIRARWQRISGATCSVWVALFLRSIQFFWSIGLLRNDSASAKDLFKR